MGQIFHQGSFTVPGSGLVDPNTGQLLSVGTPQHIQNDVYQRGAENNRTQHPTLPSDNIQNPQPLRSQVTQPTYEEAASSGATPGGANAASPGLTKAGKLLTLMTQGIQGALAGRAADEQAVIQSGGHRSGGAGMGFESGFMLPWQRAGAAQQFEQQQAQTNLLRQQADMVPTPYGMLPAALAKVILPAQIRGQAETGAAQIGAQGRVQSEQIGQRFKAVPGVGLYDTQANGGKGAVLPGTAGTVTVTPEIAQSYGLPADFIGRPMSLSNLSSLERAQSYEETVAQGSNGPVLVNRSPYSPNFGKTQSLGIGAPAMSGITEIVDPNNPGNVRIVPKSSAVGKLSPESGVAAQARDVQGKSAADAYDQYQNSITRLNIMKENLQDALKNGDQQAMLSLLANHLGMTMGVQKGARLNQALIDEAQKSQPWLQGMKAKFDSRGYLSGVTLSPEQMRSMVQLAVNRLAQDKRYYEAMGSYVPPNGSQAQGNKNVQDFGDAGDKPEGSTGTLPDGTRVIVRKGRIIKQ